jgi:hypothetical protein
MAGLRGSWLAAAVLAAVPFGCAESNSSSSTGGGGRGASAGSAGRGGSAGREVGNAGRGGGGTGGSSGSSAAGSGGKAAGGMAGVAGSGTSGGSGGTGGAGGDAGEGGGLGGQGACAEITVQTTLVPSTVTLLVDNSSSMFETQPPTWPLLYEALMDPSFGVVKALGSKIRFGFAAYKGSVTPTTEDDSACATWTKVPPAVDNHATIDAAYGPITWPPEHPKWETPTGHAIRQAASDLVADSAPGPKIILLMTDGNPNTCQVLAPECGQDNSIRSAQDAFDAGVRLFAAGVGDIIAQPNSGCPSSARCGVLHLQDLANAGAGFPVHPPPGCDDPTSMDCHYRFESCNQGSALTASYTPDAPDAVAPLLLDTAAGSATPEALAAAITGVLDDVVSCTLELDVSVTGDATPSAVLVGGTEVTLGGSPGGFTLDPTQHALTLTGTACEAFRSGAALSVRFACDQL